MWRGQVISDKFRNKRGRQKQEDTKTRQGTFLPSLRKGQGASHLPVACEEKEVEALGDPYATKL